jgi:hypothetical protein
MHLLWLKFYARKLKAKAYCDIDGIYDLEQTEAPYRRAKVAHFEKVVGAENVGRKVFRLTNMLTDYVQGSAIDDAKLENFVAKYIPDFFSDFDQFFDGSGVNIFHAVGGGYINEMWKHSYALVHVASLLKRRYGCKVLFTGQGLLPYDAKICSLLAKQDAFIDIFDTRDTSSFEIAKRFMPAETVSYTGDDALLGLGAAESLEDDLLISSEPSINVCIQSDAVGNGAAEKAQRVVELIRAASDAIGTRKVNFIACMRYDRDHYFARNLLEASKIYHFEWSDYRIVDILQRGFPINLNGFVISSRYHPHLINACLGVPGVFLEKSAYYNSKHQGAREHGSRWESERLEDITQAEVRTKVERVLSDGPLDRTRFIETRKRKQGLLHSILSLAHVKRPASFSAAPASLSSN